jgi:hypothetical protein
MNKKRVLLIVLYMNIFTFVKIIDSSEYDVDNIITSIVLEEAESKGDKKTIAFIQDITRTYNAYKSSTSLELKTKNSLSQKNLQHDSTITKKQPQKFPKANL